VIGRWLSRRVGAQQPAALARWVVVDCETSGLDPWRDSLIALAGVTVQRARISASDAFAVVVRQDVPSTRENILVHGIGDDRQLAGEPMPQALEAFLRFAGDAPRVAFRAAFDQAVLSRCAHAIGRPESGPWLDLAELLPVLFPGRGKIESTLDDWLSAFGVAHRSRHDALGDAYATAQLFLAALAEAGRQGFGTVRSVLRAVGAGRWTRS